MDAKLEDEDDGMKLKRHCEKAMVFVLETLISIVGISYSVDRMSPPFVHLLLTNQHSIYFKQRSTSQK